MLYHALPDIIWTSYVEFVSPVRAVTLKHAVHATHPIVSPVSLDTCSTPTHINALSSIHNSFVEIASLMKVHNNVMMVTY